MTEPRVISYYQIVKFQNHVHHVKYVELLSTHPEYDRKLDNLGKAVVLFRIVHNVVSVETLTTSQLNFHNDLIIFQQKIALV